MDPGLIFAVLIAGATFGFIWLMRRVGQRMVGTSEEDAKLIQHLMTTGVRARATVAAATPTGLTVNNFHVQLDVDFWLEPLDGSPRFEASKQMFLLETQFPRIGDVWPAWFDRQDPTVFVVGAPGKLDPAQIPMYREFGIRHPLDGDGAT